MQGQAPRHDIRVHDARMAHAWRAHGAGRDALSAPLMIGKDRILATNAALLLVHKGL